MTNAHRTITALLVVIAVLLAINLAVTAPSHEAQAQGVGRPAEAVAFIVKDEFMDLTAYRLWSDGTIERNVGDFGPFTPGEPCLGSPVEWCGWEVIPEIPFVP